MDIHIPDHGFQNQTLSESQRRVEIACRLFDADILHLWPAAQLAGLDRVHFEIELRARGIAPYRPRVEDLEHDFRELDEERARRNTGGAAA